MFASPSFFADIVQPSAYENISCAIFMPDYPHNLFAQHEIRVFGKAASIYIVVHAAMRFAFASRRSPSIRAVRRSNCSSP